MPLTFLRGLLACPGWEDPESRGEEAGGLCLGHQQSDLAQAGGDLLPLGFDERLWCPPCVSLLPVCTLRAVGLVRTPCIPLEGLLMDGCPGGTQGCLEAGGAACFSRLPPAGSSGAGSREWGWGGQEGMEMCPLACARRPLQELLLLLPLRGPWVRLCWGWGPCGRGCWVSLGGCSPGEGQGEQGIRHSMLFPDHPGLPS